MGGHGGLNILPQKRWNVYNFENREKVRKDEEAAAREEQLKREESRRRDSEFRLELLRQARGVPAATAGPSGSVPLPPQESRHINLFEDLQDFSSLTRSGPSDAGGDEERRDGRRNPKREEGSGRDAKRKREERPAVISPEDEKYRMGYGLAGKGVKAPWYLSRPVVVDAAEESNGGRESGRGGGRDTRKKESGGKKTIEELRAERLEREKKEKERERAVLKTARRETKRGSLSR